MLGIYCVGLIGAKYTSHPEPYEITSITAFKTEKPMGFNEAQSEFNESHAGCLIYQPKLSEFK